MELKISPSIFAADLAILGEQIKALEKYGADWLHVDVMDGHFVERHAFGADHISMLRRITKLPLDVHLMLDNPERYLIDMIDAGADIVTIHQEATNRLMSCLQKIRSYGCKVGVALSPATSEETLCYVLHEIDIILVMTVNPGEVKQEFNLAMLEKIKRVRSLIGNSLIDIEVDGSIDANNIGLCQQAGANVFVSGGYLFKNIDRHLPLLRAAIGL